MYKQDKLLVANRGEIAVRILRTARKLGLRTVSIYTPSDALSPHVRLADESVPLPLSNVVGVQVSETQAYLSPLAIVSICKEKSVTLLHPGYGFLSENAKFASLVVEAGITWLGPRPSTILKMGIKHEARQVALGTGIKIAPGSDGLVNSDEEAVLIAKRIGFPVILKATAGGGGMGMVICHEEMDLYGKFASTQARAQTLFGDPGLFLERYFPAARHIEVQIFGNGLGDVVHMGERECSVQRRHQKVIEESPSPFCTAHTGLREAICQAAVDLCRSIHYNSAGTVEFIVDEESGDFFFLETNTRIQVEHPVTEAIYPGLDLVQLMVQEGLAERYGEGGLAPTSPEMQQSTYDAMLKLGQESSRGFSIEGRIYAENPSEGFLPCPGLLQHVYLSDKGCDWLRIETWVSTGTMITPHFDPLLCKVIVTGNSRGQAISRFLEALNVNQFLGPPNNVRYLSTIVNSDVFRAGLATTRFLSTFSFTPRALKVIKSGIECTIQDLPGRTMRHGMPPSGPMDSLAFSAGNILVGNAETTEGLEIVLIPGVDFSAQFFVSCVLAITGQDISIKVNGQEKATWSTIVIPAHGKLQLETKPPALNTSGFRAYISIRGGFPGIPTFLGSKSTSVGVGGYQGRPLLPGDYLELGVCELRSSGYHPVFVPRSLVPTYPSHWVIYVLPGPQDDQEFVTAEGIAKFYKTNWRVTSSTNRLGIRLENDGKIEWARKNGGEGGSHPTNILDNGYAPGSINVNGDTPVILTKEGPDMGGYLCLCTVATAEMWKLGQISPGSTIQFKRINWDTAVELGQIYSEWIQSFKTAIFSPGVTSNIPNKITVNEYSGSSILYVKGQTSLSHDAQVTFRQAGDSCILVEFGSMTLNLFTRARLHAFQTAVQKRNIEALKTICPCIRSILFHYDPLVMKQADFLVSLIDTEARVSESVADMVFPGRRITFPIVLDDSWNREALQRYMGTTRDKAVYLPSNIQYLARNNGLEGGSSQALEKLVESDWLVLGIGFYLGCPFLVPIDPRCRLVGQKMNPSRTFTPRGAIGIAGPVAAIYPIESPGGYQLFGRTLPTWQTWGKGPDFHVDTPWLLQPFDQVRFLPISETEYIEIEKTFDAGQYKFLIEPTEFSLAQHAEFVSSISQEIDEFHQRQKHSSAKEEEREKLLLQEWEDSKFVVRDSSLILGTDDHIDVNGGTVVASLLGTVWKINCKIGDVITSSDEVLLILEAMKTEIPITAGESNVGKTVRAFGKGIKSQAIVRPGNVLVIFV